MNLSGIEIRETKTDSCDISENSFKKIRGCHILTLSLLMAKVIFTQDLK